MKAEHTPVLVEEVMSMLRPAAGSLQIDATVGGIRDARMAGSRPAIAPMRMAEAMPPVHALAGMTIAQCFVLA